jgi:hypothetical protein
VPGKAKGNRGGVGLLHGVRLEHEREVEDDTTYKQAWRVSETEREKGAVAFGLTGLDELGLAHYAARASGEKADGPARKGGDAGPSG